MGLLLLTHQGSSIVVTRCRSRQLMDFECVWRHKDLIVIFYPFLDWLHLGRGSLLRGGHGERRRAGGAPQKVVQAVLAVAGAGDTVPHLQHGDLCAEAHLGLQLLNFLII